MFLRKQASDELIEKNRNSVLFIPITLDVKGTPQAHNVVISRKNY